MRKVLIVLLILFLVGGASGATVNLADCERNTVQTAIDNAADGDVINLPACDVAWSQTVTLPDTKGVEIIGANNENCGLANINCDTRITGTADPKFTVQNHADRNTFHRISGIDFYDQEVIAIGIVQTKLWGDQSYGRYRIDHCRFYDHGGLWVSGNAYGVSDHINSYQNRGALGEYIFVTDGRTGKQHYYSNPRDIGYKDWLEPVQWGSQYFHYMEDWNIVFSVWDSNTQNWADSVAGGKKVIRNTEFRNTSCGLGGHDACTSGRRGTHAQENYNNLVIVDPTPYGPWSGNLGRGGTTLVYNNTFKSTGWSAGTPLFWGYSSPVYRYPYSGHCNVSQTQCEYNSDCPSGEKCAGCANEGEAWRKACDNVNENFCLASLQLGCTNNVDCASYGAPGDVCITIDGNIDGTGYPCRDQFGFTGDTSGDYMQSSPVMGWNNKECRDSVNPAGCTSYVDVPIIYASLDNPVVQYERDVIYYNNIDGTGICEDGIDNEPTQGGVSDGADETDPTCQEFWDYNTHMRKDYTPLPYPHPLVSGEVIIPQNDYHRGDKNQDCDINETEVGMFIDDDWLDLLEVNIWEVIDVIRIWSHGGSYAGCVASASAFVYEEVDDEVFEDYLEILEEVVPEVSSDEVVWLKFDGDFSDSSGNGNDASLSGNVGFIDGKNGKVASFDGAMGSYIKTLNKGTDEFTYSFWVRLSSFTHGAYLVNQGDLQSPYTINSVDILSWPPYNNRIRFKIEQNPSVDIELFSDSAVSLGDWIHVAISVDEDNCAKLYVDGNLEDSACGFVDPILYDRWLTIGSQFNGTIDDFRVFDRALSEEEVAGLG